MSNQTQQQIDTLIQFIHDAEDPATVTNNMVAQVLAYLADKVNTDVLSAEITSLQTTLNTLMSGDASDAIESFNEVINFLNEVTDDETLAGLLLQINNNIATKAALDSDTDRLDYSQAPTIMLDSMGADLDNADNPSVQRQYRRGVGDTIFNPITGKIVYLKTQNENQDVSRNPDSRLIYGNKNTGFLYQWKGNAMLQIARQPDSGVGGGMLVERTEDDYHVKFNFIDNSPALAVSTQSIVMGGNTKTATFKVSGQRLKGNINISVSGSNFSLNKTSLSPTDGVVAETTITLTYSGTATATATITISSTGATSKTISAQYTEQQVPTIDIATDTITFKAGVGGTQTKTLLVKGYNLEGAITLAFTNNVGGRFTLSQSSFSPSSGSVNAQVTITYTPQSGDTGTFSATLRATSTNATNVDVPLSGIVSTMDVSKNSIELTTEANTPVTDTFTIEGANLNGDVTIGVSGTGFSVSPSSITKNDAEASGGASVVVTYSPTQVGTNSGQITIQSSGITKRISLSGTAEEATDFDDETGHFNKNGIFYGAISDGNGGWTNDCKVYNPAYSASGSTYTGTINVPAQVVAGDRTFNVTHIATGAFNGCRTLHKLTLPEGLTTIEAASICNMTNKSNDTQPAVWSVWELTIPYSVVSIGNDFLYHMDNLGYTGTGLNGDTLAGYLNMANAHNPDFVNVNSSNNWFRYCYNLRELVIPDNVIKVNNDAMVGMSSLVKVTFGANTTECNYGMQSNSAIRTIIITNTSTTKLSCWYMHQDIKDNAHVYVPDEVYNVYKGDGTGTWGQFYNEDPSLNRLHKLSDLSNS